MLHLIENKFSLATATWPRQGEKNVQDNVQLEQRRQLARNSTRVRANRLQSSGWGVASYRRRRGLDR
ncbi:hypothetical protein DPEC_G00051240 [Dallia pectoralis]|uniref:Uncharacterized protein n=1 Tax=Dallia pectoralis TaxID=75939 RepID=A0ACC2HB39_DALPE|nr:hypothetical protein DPEC_G00051240 [Dallia pectoralis]